MMEEITEQNKGQQVDAQKVIASLLRQITEAAQKIALLEALVEQQQNSVNATKGNDVG